MSARALHTPVLAPLGARGSLIGRLDARTRVVAAAVFALASVAAQGLAAQGLALALAALLACLARLPLLPTLRRLLALEAFMAVALVTLPFTVPGTAIAQWGSMSISAEGIARALSILMVANGVVLATQALVGSLEAVELGHALARLGAPRRLVALMLFTLRYIEVLRQEYCRLRLSMRARAFRPRTGWHTWRTYGWMVGMLLVMSVERSERIHAAMRLRGFAGHYPMLDQPRPGRLDWGFGAVHAASVIAVLAVGMV